LLRETMWCTEGEKRYDDVRGPTILQSKEVEMGLGEIEIELQRMRAVRGW
jgi:hypothetical protein